MQHSSSKNDVDDFKKVEPLLLKENEIEVLEELQEIMIPFYDISNWLFESKNVSLPPMSFLQLNFFKAILKKSKNSF